MANEISIPYATGATLYAVVISDAAGTWAIGTALEAFDSTHWTSYAIALTELASSGGVYRAAFPALARGRYSVLVFVKAGGSAAASDGPPIGQGIIEWTGLTVEQVAEIDATGAGILTTAYDSAKTAASATAVAAIPTTAPDNADIVSALADLVTLLGRADPTSALTAVKTVTDHLSTAMELNNGNYRFTAAALAETSSGVTITPLQSTVAMPYVGSNNITLDSGTAPAITWTIVDALGIPVSLSGKSLSWTAWTDDGAGNLVGHLQYLTGNGITVGGAGNNVVTVQFVAGDLTVSLPQSMKFVLRNETNHIDLATGTVSINPVRTTVP